MRDDDELDMLIALDALKAEVQRLTAENADLRAKLAGVWAEAVAVVEDVWRDEGLPMDRGLTVLLVALRAQQERQP